MENTMSRRSLEEMATRRDRSGSLWLVQAFTGLFLVVILGVHMIAHHFVVEGGLRDYQQVLDYVANPVVFIIEVAFVIFAVVHALLGVRAIITDTRPSAGRLRAVNWVLGVVGVLAIGYGLYLALTLRQLAG
jgi:succinate dehydrogenase / fumarate reductase membrane anchor subunit